MQFNSFQFIFVFLPLTLGGYLLLRSTRFANLFMLVASLCFYAIGALWYLVPLNQLVCEANYCQFCQYDSFHAGSIVDGCGWHLHSHERIKDLPIAFLLDPKRAFTNVRSR